MNSLLGAIQLGKWELGAVTVNLPTTGSFTAAANPSVALTTIGGVARPFTSVLGTIRLGLFELGEVPAGSVNGKETFGKGSFLGSAFPDVVAAPPLARTGAFSAAAFPDVAVNGNRGPLLVVFGAFPDVAAAGIFYYAEGAFDCEPLPDVSVQGVQVGAAIFSAFPDVALSPLQGQQMSCVVGPNPPEEVIVNYAY